MSLNSQFVSVLASHEYDTFTFVKEILYNPDLTPEAMKLLLVLLDYGKRPNWKLRQNHLIAITGYTYHCFNKSMKNLEAAGYVQRKRLRVDGKLTSYQYHFSSFPLFKGKPPETQSEPVAIFKTGDSKLENRNYTYSTNSNVLEETTNPDLNSEIQEVKSPIEKKKEKKIVSSSFEKYKEIEELPRISESQKATLYKKFTRDQIILALKTFNIEKADSVFAMINSAINKKWEPMQTKDMKSKKAIETFQKAQNFLNRLPCCPVSVAIDKNFAYIFMGTSTSKYDLTDENFDLKFSEGINNLMKKQQKK